MPKYSDKSLAHLNTCHPLLKMLFEEVLRLGYDHTILEGHRSRAFHEEYQRRGLTRVPYEASKHSTVPSCGIDVAPCPIDWNDKQAFYHFAGFVKGVAKSAKISIPVRWGGDWDGDFDLNDQTFMDLVHWELVI